MVWDLVVVWGGVIDGCVNSMSTICRGGEGEVEVVVEEVVLRKLEVGGEGGGGGRENVEDIRERDMEKREIRSARDREGGSCSRGW